MDTEIRSMQILLRALTPLDYHSRVRALRWLIQRLELPFAVSPTYLEAVNSRHLDKIAAGKLQLAPVEKRA